MIGICTVHKETLLLSEISPAPEKLRIKMALYVVTHISKLTGNNSISGSHPWTASCNLFRYLVKLCGNNSLKHR